MAQGVRAGQIPARSQAARDWFRGKARNVSTTPGRLMKEDGTRLVDRPSLGEMQFFFYDPKHKKTLPFYDRFPLIFKINNVEGGFMGINLHYLPLPLRAQLMDALYDLTNNKKFDETTKLKLSYQILKGASKFGPFKPTLKMYLNKHVRSRFLVIDSSDWDTALFLPVEQFEKASKAKVWAASRKAV